MDIADFDFHLPDEQIAQDPPAERGTSRLLVLDRRSGHLTDTVFTELPGFLTAGDLLVLNDTRVFPARLLGHRVPTGGAVEMLLLRQLPALDSPLPDPGSLLSPLSPSNSPLSPSNAPLLTPSSSGSLWEALVHPGQKLKPGSRMLFERGGVRLHGEIVGRHFFGRRTVRLWSEDRGDLADTIDRIGHIPLPPYIKRDDTAVDRERYQTVFARHRGSVAAPTAGLHFTSKLLDELAGRGIDRADVTLHVGYGTFKPVRVERVEEHVVDAETLTVSPDAADALTRAHREGRRVIAVGTTTTRVLESLPLDADGRVAPATGPTQLFIRPGHRFTLVDGMITNFHLPRSSLLMLVAAFAGRERTLAAYRHAVDQGYRFYSYGDAMLIL